MAKTQAYALALGIATLYLLVIVAQNRYNLWDILPQSTSSRTITPVEVEGVPEWIRTYYQKQSVERLRFIEQLSKVRALAIYNLIVPEVYCPNILRIGGVDDGGKNVCNVRQTPRNNCRVYGYDRDAQSEDTHWQYEAINGKLTTVTIANATREDSHESTLGAEHEILIPFLGNHNVCQLFIEIHGLDATICCSLGKRIRHVTYAVNILSFTVTACIDMEYRSLSPT
ncbi:unnamed protein product [Nippostrongylus brasiliensis]|uniref:DUF3421 domain-containing protein n=1 Tax=Nippostrongylus brasiliensis TaxID=27835 RepID=A0A0N4YL12_NIPBR|nr:unnamed protein product [Nippostrongylus brasiliensis]